MMTRHSHSWQKVRNVFISSAFAVLYRCSCGAVARVLRVDQGLQVEVLTGGFGPFTSDDERQLLGSAAQELGTP